jgi:hypothetical protein
MKSRPALPCLCSIILALLLGATGCRTNRISDPVLGASYTPKNIHVFHPLLGGQIRRVVVLPPAEATEANELTAGRDLLAPILAEELGRTKKFEVLQVAPEQLRQLTGHNSWSAEERLPAGFFQALRDEFGCDAVLFTRVNEFRAYPPLAVGLNLKLVETENVKILWAADETFDAADPTVVNGARRFQRERNTLPAALADSRSILLSPRGFSRYAAETLFGTLPER